MKKYTGVFCVGLAFACLTMNPMKTNYQDLLPTVGFEDTCFVDIPNTGVTIQPIRVTQERLGLRSLDYYCSGLVKRARPVSRWAQTGEGSALLGATGFAVSLGLVVASMVAARGMLGL
jgi:hypothetical protein